MAPSGVSITFGTDSGYTYADALVPQGDTLRIRAIITAGSDPLQRFYLGLVLDSVLGQYIDTVNINTSPFIYEMTHVTRMQAGTEQLTFTAEETDGDRTLRKLNFTVQ